MWLAAQENDSMFSGNAHIIWQQATFSLHLLLNRLSNYLRAFVHNCIDFFFRGDESDYSEDAPYGENRSDGSTSSSKMMVAVEKTASDQDCVITKYVPDLSGEVFGSASDQVKLQPIKESYCFLILIFLLDRRNFRREQVHCVVPHEASASRNGFVAGGPPHFHFGASIFPREDHRLLLPFGYHLGVMLLQPLIHLLHNTTSLLFAELSKKSSPLSAWRRSSNGTCQAFTKSRKDSRSPTTRFWARPSDVTGSILTAAKRST